MLLICLNLQADKAVEEMERKCDQKLTECKEDSRLYLMHVQEEHAALVCISKFEPCIIFFLHTTHSIRLDLLLSVFISVVYRA